MNFRSILIFASCVVGTRIIMGGFYWEMSYFLSTTNIMVGVGIYTWSICVHGIIY